MQKVKEEMEKKLRLDRERAEKLRKEAESKAQAVAMKQMGMG